MRIALNPLICWLTQDTEDSYEDSLSLTFESLRPAARRALAKRYPAVRSGYTADAVIANALWEMQQRLLRQYLPALHGPGAQRRKGVTRIWPFQTGEIKVESQGRVGSIAEPFPEHEAQRELPDGSPYRFYHTDTRERRGRWLAHVLDEWVQKQRSIEEPKWEWQPDEARDTADSDRAGIDQSIEDLDFYKRLSQIAPPEDVRIIRAAFDRWSGSDPQPMTEGERKQLQRARDVVATAAAIIRSIGRDWTASMLYKRLRQLTPGERRALLLKCVARYQFSFRSQDDDQ